MRGNLQGVLTALDLSGLMVIPGDLLGAGAHICSCLAMSSGLRSFSSARHVYDVLLPARLDPTSLVV